MWHRLLLALKTHKETQLPAMLTNQMNSTQQQLPALTPQAHTQSIKTDSNQRPKGDMHLMRGAAQMAKHGAKLVGHTFGVLCGRNAGGSIPRAAKL